MSHDSSELAAIKVIRQLTSYFVERPECYQWNKEKQVDKCECVIDSNDAVSVIRAAETLLAAEENLLYIPVPVMVCGDIHGQFYDLLRLFYLTGGWSLLQKHFVKPMKFSVTNDNDALSCAQNNVITFAAPNFKFHEHCYLFLGDYVDRGSFSNECVLLLMALKVLYPKKIHLLRGNHESRSMTTRIYDDGFNFQEESIAKYGCDVVYEACMTCFDALPLSAIINSPTGNWFCAHGGLGPSVTSIDDIKSIIRRREPPLTGAMCDLLWADPLLEDVLGYALKDSEYEEFLELDYLPNPPRGCSHLFGYQAIMDFLTTTKITGIVRAHQCKEQGVSFHYDKTRSKTFKFPLVTTVFSAPNYCGTHNNRAAVMVFDLNDIQVLKYDEQGNYKMEDIPCNKDGTALHVPANEVPPQINTEPNSDSESEVPPQSRQRARALSRPEAQLLTPEITRIRQQKQKKYRRYSINVIVRDGVREPGSEQFQKALRQDSAHEVHPGWQSLRRMSGVIGRYHKLKKKASKGQMPSADNVDSPTSPNTPSPHTPLSQTSSLSNNLLHLIKDQDLNQMKFVFNSIDIDRDGQLSLSEMKKFASEINEYCEADSKEVDQLMQAMDKDCDGQISFEEFTSYMSKLQMNQIE